VFDVEALLRFLDQVQHHGIPIVAGIWPLASYRNASFMRNEVPGVVVPDAVMERMAAVESREDQLALKDLANTQNPDGSVRTEGVARCSVR